MQRGRFAPSPTGELHLGNARTALLAWLWTRSEGGRFAMRVEDLDRPRVRPGLAQRQLDELRWLGLDWDEGPTWQSERSALYEEAIGRLRASGHVYDCYCSRAEIAAAASAPHGPQDEGPRYPGTCRELSDRERAERARTRKPALRLRVPEGPVEFFDELAGHQRFDPQAEVGDFVLRRADGIHAYQLAVVVDDAAMGMTQVLRGADLLPSTARQILLYRLLGAPEPRWAHAPLVFGPQGTRLSKRGQSTSLSALAQNGEDPRRIVALLASISGLTADPSGCRPSDLVPTFALDRVPRGPAELAVGAP
jgi:glutamyl-tRNA synthetase